MSIQDKNDIRCPVCSAEYNLAAMIQVKAKGCPNCGCNQAPLKISEDGYLKINWQEVRVLAIYAQRWAATFDINIKGNREADTILTRIVNELYKYCPATGKNLDPMLGSTDVTKAVKDRVDESKMIASPYLIEFFKKE